jgi:thioredoxin-like negative regulator of GroEL
VNIDRDEGIRKRLGISGIPAYVLFRDGQEIDRLGSFPLFVKQRIRRMVKSAL